MGKKDPRVDAYIASKPEFARPILRHLRQIVHAACPKVEETIKWGMPAFDYHGLLCGMAAFKAHTALGFWKGKLILDDRGVDLDSSMGNFGRITSLRELPPKRVLVGYVKKAMALNVAGVTVKRVPKRRPTLPVPKPFAAALARHKRASATFAAFAPSHRREYIEWIAQAKTDATRDRRIATAIEWLAAGKHHNWRYEARARAKRA